MGRSLASRIEAANAALITRGETAAIGEFFAPRYVVHVGDRDVAGGPAWIRRHLDTMRRAFADPEIEVEVLVEGKDRVAWQRTTRATHRGAFKGFPATGRRIVWRDVVTSRFHEGLIAEEWVITDLAEQLLRGRRKRVRKA
jgi:predicted ester cyclase